jgi:uncharacterized protein DUF4386
MRTAKIELLNQPTYLETTTSAWKPLYKIGGVSALLMLAIIVIQFVVFMIAPQPLEGTATDWFSLFQDNKLIGLIDFELLMIVYVILSIPITLALYTLLKRINPSWTAIYLVISLIGVISFIAARPAFEMLSLSNGYAAATNDAERAISLSAGQMLIATFHGTAFHISYVLGSLTVFIISLVMLQTNIFSKTTAYVRIASSVFDFGLYIPTIGIFISVFSVLFLFIWNIMIARRLFQLGRAL